MNPYLIFLIILIFLQIGAIFLGIFLRRYETYKQPIFAVISISTILFYVLLFFGREKIYAVAPIILECSLFLELTPFLFLSIFAHYIRPAFGIAALCAIALFSLSNLYFVPKATSYLCTNYSGIVLYNHDDYDNHKESPQRLLSKEAARKILPKSESKADKQPDVYVSRYGFEFELKNQRTDYFLCKYLKCEEIVLHVIDGNQQGIYSNTTFKVYPQHFALFNNVEGRCSVETQKIKDISGENLLKQL